MKTLIKGIIVPIHPDYPPEFDGFIIIKNKKILSVTKIRPEGAFDCEVDVSGMVIMPGLVNTHTHSSMTLFRGIADDLDLKTWLEHEIFPRESKLSPENIYWGAKLAIAEFLLGGCTTFADMYFMMDEVARAVQETGIRANLCQGISGLAGKNAIDSALSFCNRWQGASDDRIHTMLGPHAIYTCPPDFMKDVIYTAKNNKLGIHMHLSETKKECTDCIETHCSTPPEILSKLCAFDVPFLAAHCVHLTNSDMELMRHENVFIALNTGSNFKLASGIAPIAKMVQAGLNLTIGTDGSASNNDLDLWEEIRWTSLAAKVVGDPKVIPAQDALKIATENGARALGWDNLGSLVPGFLADLIIVDFNKPRLTPVFSHVSHLVYATKPCDVKHVMIDGQFVVWDGKITTFDVTETMDNMIKIAQELV